MNTSRQQFILRHFIDAARSSKKTLYSCFVDLHKAYDSVPRHALWMRLQSLGVHGCMLSALQTMYTDVQIKVKIGFQLSTTAFQSQLGVKQGCPLSPTLFGLFIDSLHHYISTKCPRSGVAVAAAFDDQDVLTDRVPVLMFADDLEFLSYSSNDLQVLLDCLSQFCVCHNMTVNMSKTQVVVFTKRRPMPRPSLYISGNLVQQAVEYKYLGYLFHSSKNILYSTAALQGRILKAVGRMRLQIKRLRCHDSIPLQLRLFDALVKPLFLLNCEVWGTYFRPTTHHSLFNNHLETIHKRWLKCLLLLRKCTPSYALYSELNRQPFAMIWWKQILQFLQNHLIQLHLNDTSRDHLLAAVLQQNYLDAVSGSHNWSFDVLHMLRMSNPSFQAPPTVLGLLPWLPSVDTYLQGLFVLPKVTVGHNPRTCQSQRLLTTYVRWFHPERTNALPAYLSYGISVNKIRCFAQFRLGSHDLQVQTGAWTHIPRYLRSCDFCHSNAVDDEYHVIFECTAVQHIRQQYMHLFRGTHIVPGSVQSFMSGNDQLQLVNFIWNVTRFRLRGLPDP